MADTRKRGKEQMTDKLYELKFRPSIKYWKRQEMRHRRCASKGTAEQTRWLQTLLICGRYREAFALGEKILDSRPRSIDTIHFWHPTSPDQRARRLAILDGFIRRGEALPWALLYRGMAQGGREGLASCERIGDFPKKRYGWMGAVIGRHYLISNQFEKAGTWLERSLSTGPKDWRTHLSLAETYLCLGRRPPALRQVALALKRVSPAARGEALAWTGEIRLWLGRYRDALRDLEKASRLKAVFANCWRGAALIKLGRAAAAVKYLDSAIRTRPMDDEAYAWRGEAKRLLGKRAEALQDLSREPMGVWARLNRAMIWADSGEGARLEAEFNALPKDFVERLKRASNCDQPSLDAAQRTALVKSAFSLSRGFRRDDYDQAVWLR